MSPVSSRRGCDAGWLVLNIFKLSGGIGFTTGESVTLSSPKRDDAERKINKITGKKNKNYNEVKI